MIILFQNTLFAKECIGYILDWLPKLHRGLIVVSVTNFQHISLRHFSLWAYNTLRIDQVLISDLPCFLKSDTICVFKFPFRYMMTSKRIYLQPVSSINFCWPQGKKEGKMKVEKTEYLDNQKSFFGKLKIIVHNLAHVISFLETYGNRQHFNTVNLIY